MFDPLRDKEDIIRDVTSLFEICQEYKILKEKLETIYTTTNIADVVPCPIKHDVNDKDYIQGLLNCPHCHGTRYTIVMK